MYRFKPLEFTRHPTKGVAYPEGRVNASIYSNGKNLYIFDGVNPITIRCQVLSNLEFFLETKSNFLDAWAYNLSTKKWKMLMNKDKVNISNKLINQLIGVMYDKNFLVICTTVDIIHRRPGNWKSYLHVCDLKNKSILVQSTSGEAVEFSGANNMIRHEKCLYTIKFVGFEEYKFNVYQLNTETLEWKIVHQCEEYDSLWMGSPKHTLIYDGKSIFVFGGCIILGNGSKFIPLIRIPVFDLENFTWQMLDTHGDDSHVPHFPAMRINYSAAQYKDSVTGDVNVIVTGGVQLRVRETENTNHKMCTDVWKLNLRNLKWKYLGSLPTSIACNHSTTVTSDGQLFIFGGIFESSNNRTLSLCSSAVYSTWLAVPKLEDISWQAVLQYHPNLASKTKEEILVLGISWDIFQSRVY